MVRSSSTRFYSEFTSENIFPPSDAEGDRITISSDDELLEALDQFDGSIFKIHLKSKYKLQTISVLL